MPIYPRSPSSLRLVTGIPIACPAPVPSCQTSAPEWPSRARATAARDARWGPCKGAKEAVVTDQVLGEIKKCDSYDYYNLLHKWMFADLSQNLWSDRIAGPQIECFRRPRRPSTFVYHVYPHLTWPVPCNGALHQHMCGGIYLVNTLSVMWGPYLV